ncbi:hypothetical protein B0T09DRAFT_350924 [Sordaria sp. MPI-SDFR-AT-0083]|nr:hypothetical protein B0T09DRAFT_350924 [Sordaria sp. MPI-SDFR-AT-0083]
MSFFPLSLILLFLLLANSSSLGAFLREPRCWRSSLLEIIGVSYTWRVEPSTSNIGFGRRIVIDFAKGSRTTHCGVFNLTHTHTK